MELLGALILREVLLVVLNELLDLLLQLLIRDQLTSAHGASRSTSHLLRLLSVALYLLWDVLARLIARCALSRTQLSAARVNSLSILVVKVLLTLDHIVVALNSTLNNGRVTVMVLIAHLDLV